MRDRARHFSQSQISLHLAAEPCYAREVMLDEFPAAEFERVTAIPTHAHHFSMQTVIAHRPAKWRLLVSAQFNASDGFRCALFLSINVAAPTPRKP